MHCHEIMTVKVERVVPHLTVELAARRMRDHILGFLPVCDQEGRVLGVLTDRDIALRICAAGRHADQTRVEEVMSRPVVVCHAYDPIARIERLMTTHKKSRIVVLDADERLVGVVSLTDVVQHEEPLRAARMMRAVTGRAFRFDGPKCLHPTPPPDSAQSNPRSSRRAKAEAG
jgi:CBS domain-containing protein